MLDIFGKIVGWLALISSVFFSVAAVVVKNGQSVVVGIAFLFLWLVIKHLQKMNSKPTK
jgi:hypothetical protein